VSGLLLIGLILAATDPDLLRLIDILIWPLVVLAALATLFSRPGRTLLEPLLGRVTKLGVGTFSVELSETGARATRDEVQGTAKRYAAVLDAELRRLAHAYGVRSVLQSVVTEALDEAEQQTGYRATVHIQDPLYVAALYQLVDYYPGGNGGGRRFSIRFGILGRSWRLQRSLYEPEVPADEPDTLITAWGMTREQASGAAKGRRSFVCALLRHERKVVGILYMDAEKDDRAFGPDALVKDALGDGEDILDRLNKAGLAQLAAAVAEVAVEVAKLGPGIKYLEHD
jgi:hypothetical protein